MKWLKLLVIFMLGCLLFGCPDSKVSESSAPLAPAEFIKTDDPRAFFASYLKDLAGDRYLPTSLLENLEGHTRLQYAVPIYTRHDPAVFIDWYYADSFLQQVRQNVAAELGSMDYQLKVLGVSRDMAAKLLLLEAAGPVEHKKQLLTGGITESWKQLDENHYEVHLSNGGWSQVVGVGRESSLWKLWVLAKGA